MRERKDDRRRRWAGVGSEHQGNRLFRSVPCSNMGQVEKAKCNLESWAPQVH